MSKARGKDKKNDQNEQLESQYEEQKRQLLDATFTIRKLQERLNVLTQDNERLEHERKVQFQTYSEKVDELTIKNQTNQKRLLIMRNDLTNSEVENKKLINTVAMLEKNNIEERQDKIKQFQEIKKNNNFQVSKYQTMLTDYRLYMTERDAREKQINQLVEAREIEVANRIRDVADKERQKVQATDKIRDEMSHKIREMRQNLLSLKKEELDTTTRLTMLQNHQLTSELEYQTKQTEQIILKNEELQAKIVVLKQELQIHKQVEDELAKRSHFSKGIIKKLHARVEQLEQDLEITKEHDTQTLKKDQNQKSKPRKQQNDKNLILALQRNLDNSQKKYAELIVKYQSLKQQKEDLTLKIQNIQRIRNDIFKVIYRYYNEIILHNEPEEEKGTKVILDSEKQNELMQLNLKMLRETAVSEWKSEEVKVMGEILLNIIQPYLNRSNIMIPAVRKNLILHPESQKEFKSLLPKLSSDRQKKIFLAQEKILNDSISSIDLTSVINKQYSQEKLSINLATKIVTSKLREWGNPVLNQSRNGLKRKYKLSSSYRN